MMLTSICLIFFPFKYCKELVAKKENQEIPGSTPNWGVIFQFELENVIINKITQEDLAQRSSFDF